MTDTTNYLALNNQASKEPRFTVEVSWDTDNTILTYFTSHADADYPSDATSVYEGYLQDISGTSQRINPIDARATIGNMTITLLDKDGDISTLINTYLNSSPSYALRGKRIRIYHGFRNLAWSDYSTRQTQIIDSIAYSNGVYVINCSDVQRQKRKDIFDLAVTNITSAVAVGDTTINVVDTSDFEMCFHGPSYSDSTGGGSPETIVGYIRLEDEVISYTGTTATTFTGCTRGVLNTKEVAHSIDSGAADDRQPKVEEFVYLELPAIKLAYAILTGTLYGDGHTLPSGWHLGISTNFISTAEFTGIGTDLWDTSDDTAGFICRFQGLKKQDGKAFLEKQIYLLLGLFSPVLADGQLSLRRMTGVLTDSPYQIELNDDNLVSLGELTHDMTDVHNVFEINWNYNFQTDELTRHDLLIDQTSIDLHGTAPAIIQDFYGLHGYSHTDVTLALQRDSARDRYAGPPLRISVQVLPSLSGLEVGNIVRLNTDKIRDYSGDVTSVDRSFEIQQVQINWRTGEVSLDLFGSSAKAAPISQTDATTVLSAGFYTSDGQNIDSTASPAGPLTVSAGHVTASGTLTGNADLTNSAAIYYYNGDLTIDAGVTITVTQNVQLRVKGLLTIKGTISGVGQGISGVSALSVLGTFAAYSTNGTSGGVGSTYPQGGLYWVYGTPSSTGYLLPSKATVTNASGGNISGLPSVHIGWDGTNLTGLPTDLRGTSGGAGANVVQNIFGGYPYNFAEGGDGGDGGAGLCIIARGITILGSGKIDLSGGPGASGNAVAAYPTVYSGGGAGGAGGGVLYVIDGATAVLPDSQYFTSVNGSTPYIGTFVTGNNLASASDNRPYSSAYFGTSTGSQRYDTSSYNQRVIYVPENLTAEVDVPRETSVGSALSFDEHTNTPQTPGENLCTIDVTVTPPSDTNYSYSNIYYKLSSGTVYQYAGKAQNEYSVVLVMDGSTYDFIAKPVSIFGVESEDFVHDQTTVSNAKGGVVFASGNYIKTSSTVGQSNSPQDGNGIEITDQHIKAYDSSGTALVTIDGTTGTIRATNGIFSGHVSASAFYTSGSHLTQAYSTSDSPNTVLHLLDTTGFPSAGYGIIVDSTNDEDAFTWTSKTSTTLEGCSGLLNHNDGAVVIYNDSVVINYSTNAIYVFYGTTVTSPETPARLLKMSAAGVNSNSATITGITTSIITGGYANFSVTTGANYPVKGDQSSTTDSDGAGVAGIVTGGSHYGGYFKGSTDRGPIYLFPSTSASAPSHSAAKGTLWVTSAGVLYINTDGSTTWAKVGAQ